jgi:histidyl-tRNA synthetase
VNVKEQRWEFINGEKVKVQNDDKGVPVRKDGLVDWLKSTRTYQDWQLGKWTS